MLRAMAESELVEHQLKLTAIDERDPYRIVSFEASYFPKQFSRKGDPYRIVSFEVQATFLNN